jgi:hypothetical protein
MRWLRRLAGPVLVAWLFWGWAGGARADEAAPKPMRVGMFVSNIHSISFADSQFTAQFWAWFVHDRKDFHASNGIELPGAKNYRIADNLRDEKGGLFWDQVKYDAVMGQKWDIRFYPFDRQTLRIALESADLTSDQLPFEPDAKGSKLSDQLALDGWKVEATRLTGAEQRYQTAYGDPTLSPDQETKYSRATLEIVIKRYGWRLFVYNFTGFLFAIILCGLVLWVGAVRRFAGVIPLSVKISMGTGALFASIGAAYVLQSRLPVTTSYTLADAIQGFAFFATLLTIGAAIAHECLTSAKQPGAALAAGRLCLGLYLALLAVVIGLTVRAVLA